MALIIWNILLHYSAFFLPVHFVFLLCSPSHLFELCKPPTWGWQGLTSWESCITSGNQPTLSTELVVWSEKEQGNHLLDMIYISPEGDYKWFTSTKASSSSEEKRTNNRTTNTVGLENKVFHLNPSCIAQGDLLLGITKAHKRAKEK